MGRATSLAELINNEQCNNVIKRSLINNEQCNNDGMWKTQNNQGLWKTRTNRISSQEAEAKARFLIERLNAPNCRNFFLKCVYHLSESDIQNALESSTRPYVKCPARYFNRICKIKLTERGF